MAQPVFLGGLQLAGVERIALPVAPKPVALLEALIWSPEAETAAPLLPDATLRTGSIAPDAPAVDLSPASPAPDGAFGSVKFRIGAFPATRRWARVRESLGGCHKGAGCKAAATMLSSIAGDVRDLRFVERLAHVNRHINRTIAYMPDSRNYGRRDHWASVEEIVARGRGDCEDYAIVKMAALLRAGVPERSMSVVVVYDHGNRAFHAVLSVATSKGAYILDNMRDDVYRDATQPDYQPLYSLSADRAWIHGVRKPSLVAARAIADLGSIAPGEGARAD